MLTQTKLAISLEGHTLRLLSCRGNRVRWWAETELEPRLLRNGFLADARGFAQAVSSSSPPTKDMRGKVVAALPGFQSMLRIFRFPRNLGSKLGTAVLGEARRSIPEVERNNFLFWQAFGPKDAVQQSVFFLAVPKQSLSTYLEALGAASRRPKSLDLRPLALARAVNQQDAIIGNAESRALDVVIVQNDVPVMVRSIYLGEDFAQLEYVNGRLAEELARTIVHFNSTSREGTLPPTTPIYLTGSGALDPALAPGVEEMTQHPVGSLETDFDHPEEFPLGKYMVHLGLMLK
ncbi:MAG: hypothetical protein HYX94_00180 [Chloroflexi bacterium]|nr:hypothetical protein [Chloroflexota bacterium]